MDIEGVKRPAKLAMGRGWYWLGAFLLSGFLWALILWGISSVAGAVTVREMIGDDRYWPPVCDEPVCVLSGLGGVVPVWERHVDRNLALGRSFVVEGVCASACEIAARRARATMMPGASLVVHAASPAALGFQTGKATSNNGSQSLRSDYLQIIRATLDDPGVRPFSDAL